MNRCSNCNLLRRSLPQGECESCIENSVRAYKRRMRVEAITAYGSKCQCCGEDTFEFLVIDHVNGGGNAHRKSRGGNWGMAQEMRRQGYPDDYQVLCHNCNAAKGFYGYCPHGITIGSPITLVNV